MSKHALVIFNPTAKSPVPIEQWIGQIVEKLNKQEEYFVTFHPTAAHTTPEHLVDLFQPPLDLIIAAGGDGTVRFVLAALAKAQSEIPAAIFPLGTGNILARNLGIWQEKMFSDPLEHAFDFIVNGEPMRIDMGMMNGEYFAGMAGVGPISDAFMKPGRAAKSSFRLIAYIKALLATIAMRPRIFKITTGGRSFKVQASGVFIGNVEDLGIGRAIDLDALTDGSLDLHIINPKGFRDYVDLGFRFTGGNRHDHVADYALRLKEAVVEVLPRRGVRSAFQNAAQNLKAIITGKRTIESPRGKEVPCMIDGEECGATPMRVTVIPHAVNVLVPPSEHGKIPQPKETPTRLTASELEENIIQSTVHSLATGTSDDARYALGHNPGARPRLLEALSVQDSPEVQNRTKRTRALLRAEETLLNDQGKS
jgi:diacylglycerol kinase (ATP)